VRVWLLHMLRPNQ